MFSRLNHLFCYFFLIMFSVNSFGQHHQNCAVTYTLSGGRLGDQIIAYLHAKWVCYRYNLPFYYVPFPYSDQLALHDIETMYTKTTKQAFDQHLTLQPKEDLHNFMKKTSLNTLFTIPFFAESTQEHEPDSYIALHCAPMAYFKADWDDPIFHSTIQKLIKPKSALSLIVPPQDCISIAVHVRKNSGGFDYPFLHGKKPEEVDPTQEYVDVRYPLKHPPETYYIEQVKNIIAMFPSEKLYVYLFTDDPDPLTIYNNFRKEIPNDQVIFDYRTTENNHHSNVLEDLFSMINFDCFIRPDSNLSIVASIIGDHKITIVPAHHYWKGTLLTIDQVTVKMNFGAKLAMLTNNPLLRKALLLVKNIDDLNKTYQINSQDIIPLAVAHQLDEKRLIEAIKLNI